MTAATPRLMRAVLIVGVLVALATAAFLPRGAGAAAPATNPRILGVALVAGSSSTAGKIVVYNASGVAICVSGKCKPAEKLQNGLWNVTPRGLPQLAKGQSREVFVFAVSPSNAFSIMRKQVTVR
jgi:hypothetical protein